MAHRSSVSYPKHFSLHIFDTAHGESPIFSRLTLPTKSKTFTRLSQLCPRKILPLYHGELKVVSLGNTKDTDFLGLEFRCCYPIFFKNAEESSVEPSLEKIEVFTEEARNAGEAMCVKSLQPLGMNRCHQMIASMSKLCEMARSHPGILLTMIKQYLHENKEVGEMAAHSFTENWREGLSREMSKWKQNHSGQSSKKVCLYTYYGVVLRESDNVQEIKEHLSTLLGTSHQRALQREGMALTIGLVATRQLHITCAVLEEFILGKTPILKIDQHLEDIHWKWASSTVLLCCGHEASRTTDNILSLADSIGSQITWHSQRSHWKLIEQEPRDTLCTSACQDAMLAVAGLSKLKPPLEVKEKSEFLHPCFQSVLPLPLVESPEKHSSLMTNPPSIQVLYKQTMHTLDQVLQGFLFKTPSPGEVQYILEQMVAWMDSELPHERQRAVKSSTALLKFVVEQFRPKSQMKFTRMGYLVGMFGMFCNDPNEDTRVLAMDGVFYLYTILLQQKGHSLEADTKLKEKRKMQLFQHPNKASILDNMTSLGNSFQIVKAFADHFEVSQLNELMMTMVDGLKKNSFSQARTAAQMLSVIFKCYGTQLTEVADIGKKIYLQLSLIESIAVKKAALKAISLLVQHHTQELVFTFLEFSVLMNRDAVDLWRAMGSNPQVCPKVLHFLLKKLENRPSLTELSKLEGTYSESLAAMNTLYEIIFAPEYKNALKKVFPQLFFAMVTQIHYMFEFNKQDEDHYAYFKGDFTSVHTTKLSPQSTSVEAVKSLFSKNGFWQEFAYLELQDAWIQLATPISFCQGVSMLSRAMVDYDCPYIPGIMCHSMKMSRNEEERQRIVAMIFFTEFLRSPLGSRMVTHREVLNRLRKGIKDPCVMVRVISFHGFSNVAYSLEKGSLLQGQLLAFLNALYDPKEKVVLASLYSLTNVLYQIDKRDLIPLCVDVALSLRPFFDDDRAIIRSNSIYVFGSLVGRMESKDSPQLKDQVCRSLIPLLFHFMDQEEDVVKKAKFAFFRCASFLQWAELEKLFHRIAWEEGLRALHSIWKCFMENMFHKMDLFLSQALSYTRSKQWNIRIAAVLYIGHTVDLLPHEVSRVLDEPGMLLLYETFAQLEEDQEKFIQHMAAAHISSLKRLVHLP
uniref:Maestro heat-like repeat family member 5 n=1 Tax=Monodelphis domestica TaxID=13616 RepID=F7E7I3_MONDO